MMHLTKWLVGAVGLLGGCAVASYLHKKNRAMSFPDYQIKCETQAEKEFVNSDEIKKTILVLEKINDDEIAAFFYRSYLDGKFKKQEVTGTRYKISRCPEDIVESIEKGNCIIKKY